MVRLALTLVAHRNQVRELAAELRTLIGQALGKPGLVDYQLSIDFVDPRRIYYVEEWSSEQDLKSQIPSDRSFGPTDWLSSKNRCGEILEDL